MTRKILGILLFVLTVIGLNPSCWKGNEMREQGDSESDSSGDTDSDSDSDGDTDTGSTDEDLRDFTITIINKSNSMKSFFWGVTMSEPFEGSRAIGCSVKSEKHGTWELCRLAWGQCNQICAEVKPGGECLGECEPDDLTKKLAPGERVKILWDGTLYEENLKYCNAGIPCYDAYQARPGVYKLSIEAKNDEGILTTYSTEETVPLAKGKSFQIVLDS